jgi:hypothetical protein
MTEQEWLACADPMPMLEFLRGKASERKLRLFAVACCRQRLRPNLDDGWWSVMVAEHYAERRTTKAATTHDFCPSPSLTLSLTHSLVVGLLHEIIGNPFRPVNVERAWLTPTVTSLAATAYEERSLPSGELDPSHLAVLADALEDAGCQDADILGHLRSPGPHVRGCWALDAILGRQ